MKDPLRLRLLTRVACLLAACQLSVRCSQASEAGTAADPAPGAAQTSAGQSAGQNTGALRFAKERHDFGRVSDIEALVCDFEFTNVSDEVVEIIGVKASCGCTTPTLTRDSIGPGESEKLSAEWKPKGFGAQSKTLTVRSDGLPGGVAILTIAAEIVPFVRSEPARLDFGEIRIGQEHRARMTVSSTDPSWSIESIRASHPHVRAEVVETLDGGRRVVEVTVLASAAWGFLTNKVLLEARGVVDGKQIEHTAELPVNARVVGDVLTSSMMFSVGKLRPGAPIDHELFLYREDGAPFAVLDASVRGGQPVGMTVRAEPASYAGGFAQKLTLSGSTQGHTGYIRGTVAFLTDVPGEPVRSLNIGGNVTEE